MNFAQETSAFTGTLFYKNELVKEFKKVEDFLKIEKIDEGKYVVTMEGGQTTERTFKKKVEGQKFVQ